MKKLTPRNIFNPSAEILARKPSNANYHRPIPKDKYILKIIFVNMYTRPRDS